MLRTEASLAGRSTLGLCFDSVLFGLATGLGPRYFVVSGFARQPSSRDQWRHHISNRDYHRALDRLNPRPYRKFTQHKLNEKALYRLLGIPTGEFVGYFNPLVGTTSSGEVLQSEADLERLLGTFRGEKLCIKPLEGWGGAGVMVLDIVPENTSFSLRRTASGELVSLSRIIEQFAEPGGQSEFILERHVQQSAFYQRLNPSSLNTLRVWTLQTGADCEILGAYLRVGRAGSDVDNGSRGGMMFPVDIETGRLCPGVVKDTPHRADFEIHPDSGVAIAGQVLPDWDSIRLFVCEALARLPQTRFCGFDVAGTDDGPVLIESNVCPDKDGAAHAGIPAVRLKLAANSSR